MNLPSPQSQKFTTPLPPDCKRLFWTAPNVGLTVTSFFTTEEPKNVFHKALKIFYCNGRLVAIVTIFILHVKPLILFFNIQSSTNCNKLHCHVLQLDKPLSMETR